MNQKKIFTEMKGPYGVSVYENSLLEHFESQFQKIDFYDTSLGTMMVLDGCVMLTDQDEFVYHEMLVHVPMGFHKNPENVLVIGGGDGGTIREVLKHDSLKRAILCEIDGDVVRLSKKYFPKLTNWIDRDSRAEVKIADGVKFMDQNKESFDVILIDATDPVGPAEGLFREQFYRRVKASLKKGGIMVTQAEGPFFNLKEVKQIHEELAKVFKYVRYYLASVPTYPDGIWGFMMASDIVSEKSPISTERVNKIFETTKYYTPEIHLSAFNLPAFVKRELKY